MSDTASTDIRTLLQNVVNAATWEETRQLVIENQALLLTDEADAEFASWIDEGSAITDILTKPDLIWYRTSLQRCREEGIDSTFAALPEPRPLNKALRAFLNADGPESLSKVVQLFPEIISETASESLHNLIAQVQKTDRERAAQLSEFFAMIQMVRLANRPIPRELLQLLTDWINTETWNESRDFLQANAKRLLTEEAIEALTTMSLQSLGEDEEETEILLKHRAILEKAREESIAAAYAPLLKPPNEQDQELLEAIQAMYAVRSPAEMVKLVAQRPILLTEQAKAEIERLLAALREAGQEDLASGLEERYETLKQIKASSRQIDKELVDLVIDWINTDTWDASREMLKTHAERLLSDEAIEVIDVLLAEETGKDEEQQNQRAITALQQHRAILEKARKDSIDAAYAPFEAQRDPINALLQVLLQAQTPAQLQQAIKQYPALLDDETLDKLTRMAAANEQAGNIVAARILRLRLNEIRRLIRPMEKQPDQGNAQALPPLPERQGPINVTDSRQNVIISHSEGPVIQTNIGLNTYTLPPKKWLTPIWRGFDEGKDFVGRQQELDTLLAHLTGGENVVLTGRAISATLQGMAGIGKTYLAYKLRLEIPLRFSAKFPGGVILIDVGEKVTAEESAQIPLGKLARYAF